MFKSFLSHNKKVMDKGFFKTVKRGLYNNNEDMGQMLISQKHAHLRVVSTPEYPVPYYQRIMKALPSKEQVTLDITQALVPANESTVIRTKEFLSSFPEGLRVLDYVENHHQSSSLVTSVGSPAAQCEIYTDDLIHFLDCAHEENCRIIKDCDLADCLK